MATLNLLDLIEPDELTGFARAALRDYEENQFMLSRYFPARQTQDTMVTFGTGGGGLANTAKFRAYDAEAPIGQRETIEKKTLEIPPISEKLWLTEYERYRTMNNADQAVAAVYNDASTLMRGIAARQELARGRALQDGALTIDENGLVLTVDFGRAAGHTVSAGTTWATSTTDILTDILTWMDTYNDTNGFLPGGIVCSRTVLGYMLTNDGFRGLAFFGGTPPSRLSVEELNGQLADREIPPLTVYDAKVSVDGSSTRVIDVDSFIFTPPEGGGAAGAQVWGTTLEALEQLELRGSDAPGVVAVLMRQRDPISYWTLAAGKGIPILGNPDLTFKADVVP